MALDPKVFTKAIRRLRRCHVCCYAIDDDYMTRAFDGEAPTPELAFFKRLMVPAKVRYQYQPEMCLNEMWWEDGDLGVRVIALQLAACVCADNAL